MEASEKPIWVTIVDNRSTALGDPMAFGIVFRDDPRNENGAVSVAVTYAATLKQYVYSKSGLTRGRRMEQLFTHQISKAFVAHPIVEGR